ncbi:MAG TPA: hypothetical protein VMB49_14395 [Acidobacteriaceae bacterium]|nr:hypothetical protein [Acidobacteriaceae bacterium]
MSEPDGPAMPPDEEVDPGSPVIELATYDQDVSSQLMTRVRRAIYRRATAAQFATFAFHLPVLVFKEFWLMIVEQMDSRNAGKDANGRKAT